MTRLAERLGVSRPVLGAPMAKVAGGELAAAVSSAGGLGFVGGGYGDLDWLHEQLARTGGQPVGIGFITWRVGPDELRAAVAERPAALWLSFGDPGPLAGLVHDAGIPLVCQVTTDEEITAAIEADASVLVAQGHEAGGHGRSVRDLPSALAATVEQAGSTPVLAAGGLVTPEDLERVAAQGASGVVLGSALYATDEAIDTTAAKQRLVDAEGADTVRSSVYDVVRGPRWPDGFDGRSLRTPWTERYAGAPDALDEAAPALSRAHVEAMAADDLSVRVVWAGTGVGRIERVESARTVVERFPRIADDG